MCSQAASARERASAIALSADWLDGEVDLAASGPAPEQPGHLPHERQHRLRYRVLAVEEGLDAPLVAGRGEGRHRTERGASRPTARVGRRQRDTRVSAQTPDLARSITARDVDGAPVDD